MGGGVVTMVTPKPKVLIYLQAVGLSPGRKFLNIGLLYRRVKANFGTMAFFGLTNLGYQNPIGDKMIVNSRRASLPQGKMSWTLVKLTLALDCL